MSDPGTSPPRSTVKLGAAWAAGGAVATVAWMGFGQRAFYPAGPPGFIVDLLPAIAAPVAAGYVHRSMNVGFQTLLFLALLAAAAFAYAMAHMN